MTVAAWVRTVVAWCALLLSLLAPSPAQAQAGAVGAPIKVCVKRVAPGDRPLAILDRAAGFDCSTIQRSFGPGDYWVLSEPIRAPAFEGVGIRIASLWQDRATLFARYADDATVRLTGDGRAITRRIQLGAIIEYKLPARGHAVTRLLWRVDGATNMRGILVGARWATASDSARSNMVLAALYAGFAGLCVSLLIHNLALFGALRHRFQLAYCVMVAALLGYACSSSGVLAWMFPDLPNNDRLRVNYVTLAMSATAALLFARSFFEERIFAGWLDRLTRGVCVAVMGSAVLFVVAAPWQAELLDKLYAASFAWLLLAAIPILWRAYRMRSNYLWLFGIAWIGPVGFASLRLMNSFGMLEYSFLVDNSTLLAMASEAITSSLAIAYRIRLLSRDRDRAREQEVEARLLADTDPLTGLLNRRAFLRQAIGRPGEQTLLLLDIDHFKLVNDTIGHDGGDEVLRLVARTLRDSVPDGSLVARLGGEEFACLCSAVDAPLPESVLERLRAARMPFDITVTSSIGVCTGPLAREVDWKAAYRRADQALFAAKAAGRDRARDAALLAA